MRSARRKRSFSLIEVVIATAVFATTIVAIIGLMAPMNRTTSHVLDAETGSRLLESIEAELLRLGFTTIADDLVPDAPIFLYSTPDGSRVLRGIDPELEEEEEDYDADNDLDDDTPGIAQRDRFFVITLNLADDFDADISGSVPISARVEWPYRLPDGPASTANDPRTDPSRVVAEPLRQSFTTFYAITR